MYYVYIVIITLQLNIRMHKYMEYKDLVYGVQGFSGYSFNSSEGINGS